MISALLALLLFTAPTMEPSTPTPSLHDFSMTTIDGKSVNLSQYKGKVVLVVNVASFCGYTRQYEPLEKLYRTYSEKGFVVLGFPANDFGAQEPGSDEEIQSFCSTKYDVTFPMFSKITVKGPEQHKLYAWLTSEHKGVPSGEVAWNFEKFLIDQNGNVVGRYKSNVEPLSDEIVTKVEGLLK